MDVAAADRGAQVRRQKKQKGTIGLGRRFHTDLLFWKWKIDHELLHECEALSAPGYTVIQNPEIRYYLSDASFEAVGCIFVKRKGFSWYNFPKELTSDLKRKADRRETCTTTIILLESFGTVVTSWVMLELKGDTSDAKSDPFLLRDDNTPAVSWISRFWGARDKRPRLLMGMLGRLLINRGWNHIETHIPGVPSTPTKCISG